MSARWVTVSRTSPEAAAIAVAAEALMRGGVVAFATDTLYGLAVDPRREDAVDRLYAAKNRPPSSAIPVIAGSLAQAQAAGMLGVAEMRLAEAFWPGPLSLVVPARDIVCRAALAGGTTIAIRVPDHAVARALAGAFGFCITATSANISGEPAPDSPAALSPRLVEAIDLVLDSGPARGGAPSTLVTISEGRPVLLRAGAVPWDRVLRSLE